LLKWTFLSFSPNFGENFEIESSLGMLECVWDYDFIDNKCDFKPNRRT